MMKPFELTQLDRNQICLLIKHFFEFGPGLVCLKQDVLNASIKNMFKTI